MVEIMLKEILKSKNKTKYWLFKQTGISQNNIARLEKNETKSINFDVLEKICVALEIEPSNLIKIEKDKDKK